MPTAPPQAPAPSRNPDLVVPPGPNGAPVWGSKNITTVEEAIDTVASVEFKNNPDYAYRGSPRSDGNFDVYVRSLSLEKQGGTGTVGHYKVEPDGNFVLVK